MAAFKMQQLSTIDRVVAGAGAIALVSLFLPWYGASTPIYSASVSGFSTSYGWLGGLLIVATGAYLALLRSGTKLPELPAGPGVVVLGASLLGTVIVALRWLTLPSGSASVGGVTYLSYGPRVGIILTLVVGLVQVGCAFTLFRRSGERVPWSTSHGSPGETPPPADQ